MTAWEELLIGAALLAVLAALVLAAWGRWRTRRVMLRLERMLEEAIRGTFTETSFDESLFSAVETQLAHYLAASAVSARNLQTGHKQWYFGKGLDGFTPMGPCLVTRDAFAQPPAQAIRTWINGELRQDAVTDELIFSISHVIAELSQGMTLQAGTVIATGTPAGVGMGFDPPKFLKAGDVVRCEIEGIGVLENTVE